MSPKASSPTVRRRRVARRLVELREQAKLTVKQAAEALGMAEATLYRIENAERGTSAGNVSLALDVYASKGAVVTSEERAVLIQLAKEARRRGWWVGYGLDETFALYVGLETEASDAWTYQGELVPGLLQTPAYARSLREVGLPAVAPEAVERWVEVRTRRQQRLTDDDPITLWAVVSEAALRRKVGGPQVMHEQLEALVEYAARPNIMLQVLPFDAGAHPVMDSPFTILFFGEPADTPVVNLDTATENIYLEDPMRVAWHRVAFDHLRAVALSQAATVAMIRSIIQEQDRKREVDGDVP